MRTLTAAALLAIAAVSPALGQTTGRLIAVDSSRALYEINMDTRAKTQMITVRANASTRAVLA